MGYVHSTKDIDNYRIKIVSDDCPENPRDFGGITTMVCFHGRYDLGDSHDYRQEDYDSWKELKLQIMKDGAFVILPLFLYDHSGITIRTTPFSCPWDSGQVGWVYVSHETAFNEYGEDYESKETEIIKNMIAEVDTYDAYLTGEVYGYQIYKVETCNMGCEHEEQVDSCYGYYGEKDAMEEAESIVENLKTKDIEESAANAVLFT